MKDAEAAIWCIRSKAKEISTSAFQANGIDAKEELGVRAGLDDLRMGRIKSLFQIERELERRERIQDGRKT